MDVSLSKSQFVLLRSLSFLALIISTLVTSPDLALKMDWQGQKLAEQLMQILLVSFALGAFAIGYVLGSFQLMLLIYAGGVVVTSLVTVPNWPWYNKHPMSWLEPVEAERHPKPEKAAAPMVKKKSTKQK